MLTYSSIHHSMQTDLTVTELEIAKNLADLSDIITGREKRNLITINQKLILKVENFCSRNVITNVDVKDLDYIIYFLQRNRGKMCFPKRNRNACDMHKKKHQKCPIFCIKRKLEFEVD